MQISKAKRLKALEEENARLGCLIEINKYQQQQILVWNIILIL